MQAEAFYKKGWCQFPYDPVLAEWVSHTVPFARDAISDPKNGRWLRCGGTWFVGVNALPNDAQGSVTNGPPLSGIAVDFISDSLGFKDFDWDLAQVSVCYPGYPQRMLESESDAAFRYRRDRDAAHIDGLLAEGPNRRRHLREYHSFIFGVPMVASSPDASPFVIWEGSHEIVHDTFSQCFAGLSPECWKDKDITETYHEVRRKIFQECERVEICANPGESYLAHRLSLHGIAPWSESATASPDGRMICYFRPEIRGPRQWLTGP